MLQYVRRARGSWYQVARPWGGGDRNSRRHRQASPRPETEQFAAVLRRIHDAARMRRQTGPRPGTESSSLRTTLYAAQCVWGPVTLGTWHAAAHCDKRGGRAASVREREREWCSTAHGKGGHDMYMHVPADARILRPAQEHRHESTHQHASSTPAHQHTSTLQEHRLIKATSNRHTAAPSTPSRVTAAHSACWARGARARARVRA